MFEIKAGTKIRVIKKGKEWRAPNFTDTTAAKDNLFDKEEVVIDPVGKLGCHRGDQNVIGGDYARAGYYGFERDGWIVLCHISLVSYLD